MSWAAERNPEMLLATLAILGLAGIAWGLIAARSAFRKRSVIVLARGLRVYPLFVAAGVILASASFFVQYPYDAVTRVYGFPFVSAIFEFHDGQWQDFVGPTTVPAVVGNAVFFFLLPHIIFDLIIRRKAPGERAAG
jgi:hypothetical protein